MSNENGTLVTEEKKPQQAAETDGILNSPYCRELRSKRYFFLQAMPTEEHHLLDHTGHCWCRRTMQVVGPDGGRALPRICTAERSCYKSLFETE